MAEGTVMSQGTKKSMPVGSPRKYSRRINASDKAPNKSLSVETFIYAFYTSLSMVVSTSTVRAKLCCRTSLRVPALGQGRVGHDTTLAVREQLQSHIQMREFGRRITTSAHANYLI